MKNEIIFVYNSSYFGRWGEDNTTNITIFSDFSDISKWPYQIKVEERVEDSLDDEDNCDSTTYHKISKNLFENLKNTIAKHTELTKLPENIDYVMVRDGTSEYFEFVCPSFKKIINGTSLLSIGAHEIEKDPNSKQYCAILYRAYQDIKKLIDTEQPNVL